MNRFLLLPAAALLTATGCVSNDGRVDCFPPNLNVYWTPGPPPTGGFQVPGLVAAGYPAELDCADAGVVSVQVFVHGSIVPCVGGAANCVDANSWRCTVGGVSVPIASGGTYSVEVDGFGSTGNLKYVSTDSIGAFSCGDTAAGVFPQGLSGTLGIDYAFIPAANCQPGSDIVWDLRRGLSTAFDTNSIACGTTNPFDVYGGFDVLAGVYTLDSIAEVVGTTSYHALCSYTFVHAGDESGSAALIVNMPLPTATCF